MVFLKVLLVVVESLVGLMLIGLILLQKSKNEGLGLAFGAGVGESLFGARAGNVLSRATVVLGIFFMANTLLLGILFAKKDHLVMDEAVPPVASAPLSPGVQDSPADPLDLVVPDTGSADASLPAGGSSAPEGEPAN